MVRKYKVSGVAGIAATDGNTASSQRPTDSAERLSKTKPGPLWSRATAGNPARTNIA